MDASSQIVIVSNRGPNDFVWRDGAWITRPAAGGLVSMLEPLARQPNVTWFCCVSEPPDAKQEREGLFTTAADETDPDLNVVPVPLPASLYHAYYGQISNEVLWMLQHHVIGESGFSRLDARRHAAWTAYLEANRRLADAIARATERPRALLIQDYHLYPLPALLRQRCPDTPILHFTHIPFPDPPTLKLLPNAWRAAILEGLLGADIVGMQTDWDVHAFLASCRDLLGLEVDYEATTVIATDGREVRVRAFPASTDPEAVLRLMQSEEVEAARQRLGLATETATIIRVDRLDPSKNQIIGFEAFGRLLESRPDLCGKARFLAFLIPSRTDLSIYRAYHDTVFGLIDAINERFSVACGGPPITVFYTNDREQALAAMEACDVLLVNSLEDGMNLVAKEWAVVSRRPGVMIVSETAGVAAQMGDCALPISPLDLEGTAQAMAQAIDMPTAERERRLVACRESVYGWTAADWLSAQLEALGLPAPTANVAAC